ncbi:hypothetical protein [Sphingomonas sp. S6]|jgi:hypothetical protein|uniref:hypothetical protein n=1 Tax=Sphingomonas sp. S6 TaxID=3368600 RepID=UPI000F973AEE|nr:hypothetical protein [uncultured Sphingomonas sp.]RTL17452.1 MAG: hypothetical protein EKK50_09390 [Sphingomonadaceae bacterium]
MKLTEMIHQTTLAFRPAQHPVFALLALAMMLIALIAIVALICSAGPDAGAIVRTAIGYVA